MRKLGMAVGGLVMSALPVAAAAQRTHPAAPSGASAPAAVPSTGTPVDDNGDDGDIVVNGNRVQAGAVIGDIPPEEQLGPAEIRSYGVSSVSELLDELAPQTRSDRGSGGAPVVLLNGRRISSFAEIRDLPTEAILRVDILPEEVALKYGYSADQRVVNFVLRPRFRSLALEGSDQQATEGGRNTPRGNFTLTNIKHDDRFNLNLQYTESPMLLESQRNLVSTADTGNFALGGNIVPGTGSTDGQIDPAFGLVNGQPVTIAGVPASAANGAPALSSFLANDPNTTDVRPYRSLLSATQTFSGNAVLAKALSKSLTATINGRFEYDSTTSDQGLPTVDLTIPTGDPFSPFSRDVVLDRYVDQGLPLQQSIQTLNSHLGVSVNHTGKRWRWSVIGSYDRVDTNTFTETGFDTTAAQAALNAGAVDFNPFGALTAPYVVPAGGNRATSTSNAYTIDALLTGPLVHLPSGDVTTSWKIGYTGNELDSSSYRLGVASSADLTRDIENGQINVDVPLTSRRNNFLSAVGNLSANVNYAVNHLSDFGTLNTLGYGANWSPIDQVRVLVSFTDQDQAPSQAQLGNPVITTPNVRVFDYVNATTVDVTQVTGGNPALIADKRHVFKAELNLKPLKNTDFSITANYIKTRTDNPIASFPSATAAIEAAFPDRFTRDAEGDLIRIDARPVNFDRADTSELRWGFNLSLPLKSKMQKEFEAFRAGKGPNPFQHMDVQALRSLRNAPSMFGGTITDSNRSQGAGGRRGGGGGGTGGGGFGGGNGGGFGGSGNSGGMGTTEGGNGAPSSDATTNSPPPGTAPDSGSAAGTAPSPDGQAGGAGGAGGGGFRGGGGGGFGGGRGGFGGGGRRGGFGGARGGGGRLQFALYHTWHFVDRLKIRDGVPDLDLLNGGATGTGGQSRHELEGQAGYSNNGIGIRTSVNWQSATTVQGGTVDSPETLHFSSLGTANLRIFYDLSQQLSFVAKHHWALGMRVNLDVTNLFDTRQHVTDQTGVTPISYQPDYLNPLGRTVRLTVRKLIF